MTYTGYCLTSYDKEKCKDCPTLLDCMDFGINELSKDIDKLKASQQDDSTNDDRWWEGGYCPDCGWEMAHDETCKYHR